MKKLFGRKKKEKLKNATHINMGGVYVLGVMYVIFMVVLIAVQANVRYTIRADRLTLLPREELAKLKTEQLERMGSSFQTIQNGQSEADGTASQTEQDTLQEQEIQPVTDEAATQTEQDIQQKQDVHKDTLLVIEEGDAGSEKAQKLYIPVFSQMKIDFDVCTAEAFEPEMIPEYDKIVLAITHYPLLADTIADLKVWVKQGGSLMIAYPPEVSGSYQTLYEILGIKDSGDTTLVEGLHFDKNFMIGGTAKDYYIIDAYDCSLGLSITDDCEVYIRSTDEYSVPLVWRRKAGEGTIVVDNFGILEKAYRGIHCAAYSLMGDYCIYPVINGAAFYIDDFPSPVPGGDGQYITRDYNMSISDFYSQVWWNDIYELAKKHNIYYTGLVIEDYSNQVSGEFVRNREVRRFQYFGNMLLRSGGEIGIHGYNHMPLVLENFDYKDQYDAYIQWPSVEDMRNALDEVLDFTHDLFKDEELLVYVPPSNVLSREGRELLNETSIRSVAAVYLSTDMAFEQEFEVSEDGMINCPRITSGCVIDEYMELAALSELNLHFVNTHFVHPDDVLDEDRGARLGWAKLYKNLCSYYDWLYKVSPKIRNMTGTELAAAVEHYDLVEVNRSFADDKLTLKLDNFNGENWMLFRVNNGEKLLRVRGGGFDEVADGLYLIRCLKDEVELEIYK